MAKETIYAISVVKQEALIEKFCFKECGGLAFGILTDPVLGSFLACKKVDCPHEEQAIPFGDGVSLRILEVDGGEFQATTTCQSDAG